MNDQWTNRLSEYLDGELNASERQAFESHLATCAACGQTLDELRRVVTRAGTLEDRPPARDLWSGVARRIGVSVPNAVVDLNERRRRRFSFTMPQLAAAAVVLISASGAGVWAALNSARPSAVGSQPTVESRTPTANLIAWVDSNQAYDASVAQLQQVLETGRGQLDTATVRVLEANLHIIDQAIAQARAALTKDPGSAYLSLHLAQTMRTKLELLRRAQAIAVRS